MIPSLNIPPNRGYSTVLRFALGLVLAMFVFVQAQAAESFQYRGFNCKFIDSRQDNIELIMRKQIDKVLAVGIPEVLVNFLRSVPIDLSNSNENKHGHSMEGEPGYFDNGVVTIYPGIVDYSENPVLLHELMHALHALHIQDGVHNRDIQMYFQRANGLGVYNVRSHMMSNDFEFFATTATTYLYGVTAQEPFSREKIKSNQPYYYQYLSQLFGEQAGHYQGKLE